MSRFIRLSGAALAVAAAPLLAQVKQPDPNTVIDSASVSTAPLGGGPQELVPLSGVIRDPLGAVVQGATVDLIQRGKIVRTTTSESTGAYHLYIPGKGRYTLEVSAPTFQTVTTPSQYLTGYPAHIDLTLATPTIPNPSPSLPPVSKPRKPRPAPPSRFCRRLTFAT